MIFVVISTKRKVRIYIFLSLLKYNSYCESSAFSCYKEVSAVISGKDNFRIPKKILNSGKKEAISHQKEKLTDSYPTTQLFFTTWFCKDLILIFIRGDNDPLFSK